MNISVELVKKEEKEILRNLLEKYGYELSQYYGKYNTIKDDPHQDALYDDGTIGHILIFDT